jgi:hypothetical protein
MLGVERIHVMIKKLGKSKKNIMASIQKNNDLLCQSQLEWRYQKDHKWSNDGKGSSLHLKQPVPLQQGKVQPRGGMWKRKASRSVFQALENEWTIHNRDFDRLRDRWSTYAKRHRRSRSKRPFVEFREWIQQQDLPPEHKRYK